MNLVLSKAKAQALSTKLITSQRHLASLNKGGGSLGGEMTFGNPPLDVLQYEILCQSPVNLKHILQVQT